MLAEETKKHENLHVVIVQHSEQKESEEWFERIGWVIFAYLSFIAVSSLQQIRPLPS